ncbi:MAG: BatA domain-containing protein [Nitrospinae bacterium]|nr:BatA domain-containing protein [Nitrospinota bacterium]
MSFQFLHGALLWGMGLVFLPILIHLLRRRLVRRHRLPTFEFLLRTQRRITNRSRLRNWILLFLRLCAVGLIIFLASRPLLETEGGVAGVGWFPAHTVAVIDNSASMAFQTEKGSRFDVTKRAVRRMIEDMSDADRMSITMTVGESAAAPLKELKRKDAFAALEQVHQTDGKGAPARVVQHALENASPKAGRRNIVVFSDFARGDWESFQIRNLKQWNPHVHLQFVRVAPEAGVEDLSLRDVKMKPWPPKAGFSFTIGARVFNRGEEKKSKVPVKLYVGEELQETIEVDLDPNEASPVSFRVNAPEKGVLYGRLELPEDNLSTTNWFYFAAGIGKRLRALVIDGDPKRGIQDSETFFVVNALSAAPLGGESPVLTHVVASYELNKVGWDEYDYVIACNLGRWPAQAKQQLRSFVEKGGGLFWATGELSSEKSAGLGWLPGTTRGPVTLRPSRSLKIAQGEGAHPVFSFLGTSGGRFFSALRLARITPLEPARGGRTLLELPDDTPVLVVGSVGAGRVLVWGSTCDRDWTDLAVRPVFVPFMRGVSDFLGGSRKGVSSSADAGDAFEIRAPIRRVGEAIQIRGPAQEERAIQFMEKTPGPESARADGLRLGKSGGGAAVAYYRGADRAGFYRVLTPDEKHFVAVNAPASESKISPVEMSTFKEKLEKLDVRDLPANDSDPLRSILSLIDLGVLLFLALGGIFVAEAFLADRT